MAGAKEAGAVGGRAGGAKGASAGRGVGLAVTLTVAALVAGAVGGCQAPTRAAPDDAPSGATAPEDVQASALPGDASAELTARADCEGKGCDPSGGEASRLPICAPGAPKCDPEQNGLGVFVARNGRFCLPTVGSGRLCVESFINGPDGVKVRLSPAAAREKPVEWEVKASFRPEGFALPQLNVLKSISTDKGRLVIKYRRLLPVPPGEPLPPNLEVTDEQLHWLWLGFANKYNNEEVAFQLRFEHVDDAALADGPSPREPIERYLAEFRRGDPSPEGWSSWASLCTDPAGDKLLASFVGGHEVDLRSAKVTANAQAVTMSCVTGAIDTCLTWGYAPWAGEGDEKRAMVFGACLQAKRAAYYVARGDLGSYTKPGTPILLHDSYGIHNDAIGNASLEAVWSSTGARCFNLPKRRRPELLTEGHPEGISMNACEPGAGLGLLSTGKATQSSTTD